MRKIHSAEEMKMKVNFETLRNLLLQDKFENRWNFPLAFWTLPHDRRLPLTLLNYPLKTILGLSFEELANTAGIGQKKLNSLVLLLQRASEDAPPTKPILMEETGHEAPTSEPEPALFRPVDANGKFDHSLVSEALWHEWRETAELHNLSEMKLGKLAPSLLELPTVIWQSPLKTYTGQTLHEIRNLRTHGEKRLHVVLEVFFVAHEMLSQAGRHPRLAVRLEPRFIAPMEQWLQEVLSRESLPSRNEIMSHVVLPLIDQLTVDAGADVVHLVRGRLGVDGDSVSVRHQSRELRVTRARIYQLLEECETIMEVRWPQGRYYFQDLAERFKGDRQDSLAAELFSHTHDLFFPHKYSRLETVLSEVE